MLNSCDFTGRIVSEPKFFESGPRALFTLAVDRDQKNENGEYDSDYLDFIAWRSTAEFVQKYFHQGDMVSVSNARAQVRSYVDSSGVKHRKVEFVAGIVYFGQAKKSDENSLNVE